MAPGHALNLRPIVLPIGPAEHPDGAQCAARLVLEQTNLGQFRISMGHPRRNGLWPYADWYAKQGMPDDQAG